MHTPQKIDLVIVNRQGTRRGVTDFLSSLLGASCRVSVWLAITQGGAHDALEATRREAAGPGQRHLAAAAAAGPPVPRDATLSTRAFDVGDDQEAHAAARWARLVVAILDAAHDPRTITDWSRFASTPLGMLRNWCRTAGISPRRSLVFARLLRAVIMSDGGRYQPEELFDEVDRRTLNGLLQLAGLEARCFPHDVDEFLREQALVRDGDALCQVRRALDERRNPERGAPAKRPGPSGS